MKAVCIVEANHLCLSCVCIYYMVCWGHCWGVLCWGHWSAGVTTEVTAGLTAGVTKVTAGVTKVTAGVTAGV